MKQICYASMCPSIAGLIHWPKQTLATFFQGWASAAIGRRSWGPIPKDNTMGMPLQTMLSFPDSRGGLMESQGIFVQSGKPQNFPICMPRKSNLGHTYANGEPAQAVQGLQRPDSMHPRNENSHLKANRYLMQNSSTNSSHLCHSHRFWVFVG